MLGDIALSDLSTGALLALVVLMILTGMLVPRRVLKDKTDEAERWRKAYEAERTARGIADAQTNELLELAKTTHDFILAMGKASAKIRESGDADASAMDA